MGVFLRTSKTRRDKEQESEKGIYWLLSSFRIVAIRRIFTILRSTLHDLVSRARHNAAFLVVI